MGDEERIEEEKQSLLSNERGITLAGIYLIYCQITVYILI